MKKKHEKNSDHQLSNHMFFEIQQTHESHRIHEQNDQYKSKR